MIKAETSFTFHPVGQGLFYSGIIRFNANDPQHKKESKFIYDCGSESQKKIEYEIKRFGNRCSDKNIDMLVISHFHKDHINGLDYLLNNFHVKRTFLPYTTDIERLIIAAKNLDASSSYFSFLADPYNYLKEKGVEEIIVIKGESKGEMEHTYPEPPAEIDISKPINDNNSQNSKNNKVFVVRHNIYVHLLGLWFFKFYVQEIDEKKKEKFESCMYLRSYDEINSRLVKEIMNILYLGKKLEECYSNSRQVKGLIINELCSKYLYLRKNSKKCTSKQVEELISKICSEYRLRECTSKQVEELISKICSKYLSLRDKLKKCYRTISRNLNDTSMMVMHTPINEKNIYNKLSSFYWEFRYGLYPFCLMRYPHMRDCFSLCEKVRYVHKMFGHSLTGDIFGHSLTGDINLNKKYPSIQKHFNDFKGKICVNQIPHHGARKNWNNDFLDDFMPIFNIASAGEKNKYGHPNLDVFENIYEKLFIPIHVNEDNWFTCKTNIEW